MRNLRNAPLLASKKSIVLNDNIAEKLIPKLIAEKLIQDRLQILQRFRNLFPATVSTFLSLLELQA